MFLNGILHNSEACHGLTDAHIASLEYLDLALLNSHENLEEIGMTYQQATSNQMSKTKLKKPC